MIGADGRFQFVTAIDHERRERVCVDCGEVKPFCEFHTWPTGTPRAACKKCFHARGKLYETPESKARQADLARKRQSELSVPLNEANKARMIRHRARLQAIITFFKAKPCTDCGKRFPTCAMEFDHIRPGKLKNVSALVGDTHSIEAVEREIALCEVVCARCHRHRTYTRRKALAPESKRKKPMGAVEAANKALVYEKKDAPCSECLGRFNPWQMDFDHIDRKAKRYTIARLTHTAIRTETLIAELQKVRLLCANCHRIKTTREEDNSAPDSSC